MSIELWSYALLSTFVVSIIPVIFLFLVPLISGGGQKKSSNKKGKSQEKSTIKISGEWLNWFMCFAAGALIGDAFLHLISHSHNHNHNHDHNHLHDHDHSNGPMAILLGIVAFFGVEIFSSSHESSCHSHHNHSHSHGVNGLLSLLADSVHNFTDGLTIAAAWASSSSAGISTTVAIFLHEIPHELGDYAILTKAGYSHAQILKCQFLTAAAAFAGTLLGLALHFYSSTSSHILTRWILPFSAGGFIYLALASMVPEIVKSSRNEGKNIMKFLIFTSGIFLMTLLD